MTHSRGNPKVRGRCGGREELVLSRSLERGQGWRVLKSPGKLGMVAFGVLVLFFVGYLLWGLIFPPLKPVEEGEELVRPQVRLTAPKMAPDIPTGLGRPQKKRNTSQTFTLPESDPSTDMQSIEPPAPKPSLPPAPPMR